MWLWLDGWERDLIDGIAGCAVPGDFIRTTMGFIRTTAGDIRRLGAVIRKCLCCCRFWIALRAESGEKMLPGIFIRTNFGILKNLPGY
ncbi:hypothetical protein MKZ25_05280 [Solibacillus sp. FSL W7-1464]|uniref:hypothetical protein n=1 Tax=Solibacillus sp. FSL W7-1464 TaxID=2921706 RepID=UPI0030F9B9D3